MAYGITLAQINTNLGGLGRSNTAWGFPANTNFHTLLMSYWMCGPYNATPGLTGSPGIWPAFISARFFGLGADGSIALTNQALGSSGAFFTGSIPNQQPTSPLGCLLHFIMSVDTHAQIVQVYINDRPVTVTGTWTGAQPLDFNVANSANIWSWNVSNVIGTGIHPTLGDVWISNTSSFVDLSVVANRRKFIDAQMKPVDLGDTGTIPFGYQPAMYMSIRPGGVATDILTNRGVGGGTWGYDQNPPTFQTDGSCVAIPVPVPPPLSLAMDDLLVTATVPPDNQIYLEWSDNRGHSYGIPVGQDIGEPGAYLTSVQFQRLGYARDRVFRLTTSAPVAFSLQGAWIEVTPALT